MRIRLTPKQAESVAELAKAGAVVVGLGTGNNVAVETASGKTASVGRRGAIRLND
jgi:hypothetical protein